MTASRKLQVIGRFTEVLPNNWKLYAENVRDTYHASLLHVFFATFRINRLSQGGGVSVSGNGGCHVSTTLAPTQETDTAYDGMRSVDEGLHLSDPSMLDAEDEHGDRVRQQILSVFPKLRDAAHLQRHGDPPVRAARCGQDRSQLDLPRLRGRYRRRCAAAG